MKTLFVRKLMVFGAIILSIPLTVTAESQGGSSGNGDGDLALNSPLPQGMDRFDQAIRLWEQSSLPTPQQLERNFEYRPFTIIKEVTNGGVKIVHSSAHFGVTLFDLGELGIDVRVNEGGVDVSTTVLNGSVTYTIENFAGGSASVARDIRITARGKLIIRSRSLNGKCDVSDMVERNGVCAIYYLR
jgi:hypothetical protein